MSDRVRGDLLLVMVTVIAAVTWLLSKKSLETVPPFLFIFVRFILAGALLSLLCRRTLIGMGISEWKISFQSGTLFGVAMLLWVVGIYQSKHLGEAAFITSLAVIMIPLLGVLVFGEPFSLKLLLPMLMALVGLGFLTLEGEVRLEMSQIYMLAAALVFALHFVMTSRYLAHTPPLGLAAIQMITVGLTGFVAALYASIFGDLYFRLDWGLGVWTWVLIISLVGTLLRFALQLYAMGFCSANHAGMILVLEPVWISMFAAFFLGELMSWSQWLGCGLIFVATVVYQLTRLLRRK